MRLVKVATAREVIRRDWCIEDPVLRELPNLKMQAGTNYRIQSDQALRLDALWSRTGRSRLDPQRLDCGGSIPISRYQDEAVCGERLPLRR